MKINQYKILFITCLLSFSQANLIKAQIKQPNSSFNVLSSTKDNITLELNIPRFEKTTKLFHDKEYDILNIDDLVKSPLFI